MTEMTLEQAMRNALAAERYSAFFYLELAEKTADLNTREFLLRMSKQEEEHARQVRRIGGLLGAGELPVKPNIDFKGVETVRGEWTDRRDLTYLEALDIAVASEEHAERFYRMLSGLFEGETSLLFDTLANAEVQHRGYLEQIRRNAGAQQQQVPIELSPDDLVPAADD